jgi:hypothetical protein
MTPFSFEHVFRAASVAEVFAAYFDPAHTAEQDRRLDITEREILSFTDGPDELHRVSRVVPRRQLPAIVRPLVTGQLHYVETLCWRKADHVIDLTIKPSILRDRTVIKATYGLSEAGIGAIRRQYSGVVSVDIALLSSRIERGIVAEFERSMPAATSCTQEWLDRFERSVAARA